MPPNTSLLRLFRPSICSSCRQSMRKGPQASLSTSTRLSGDEKPSKSEATLQQEASKPTTTSEDASNVFQDMLGMVKDVEIHQRPTTKRQGTKGLMENIANAIVPQNTPGAAMPVPSSLRARKEPHHLHVYAHKHNTHIVLTRPNREPILTYSAGNIGFRKAQRGSFDAAFQLAAYVMRTITDKGLLRKGYMQWAEDDSTSQAKRKKIEAPIQNLEIVLRGFGKGREAVVKALLGTEGRGLRDMVTVVSDDTKLKFGGTRSPNPRRLG